MLNKTPSITNERINAYYKSLRWSLPAKDAIITHRDKLLQALYAQELEEFTRHPHFEKIISSKNILHPHEKYVKPAIIH